MGKTIELTCEQCGVAYSKSLAEHKRCESRGYRRFCSKNCRFVFMKMNGSESVQHLQSWVQSDSNKLHIKSISKESDPFREFLRRARRRVITKNKELNLSLNDLKKVWDEQNGVCPYTGWKLELPNHKKNKNPKTASLDRIDSSKGYVIGNIQFVSVMANFAKCDFSNTQMSEFCDAIKKNWGSP